MASPEIIGTNGISDLGGSLTTSLSSSTIFGSAVNDNFALTDLSPQPKAAAATDPLVSYLSTENTTGGDLLQSSQPKAASVSAPTDNVFTKSLLFNQPLSLAATDFPSLSSSTAAHISSESDWLTGSTNSTPLVGLTSNNDPLTNPATAGTVSNAETSEIAATSVSQTTAESPPPDLVVTAATTPTASPTWGETIAVTWTVTNQGSGTALASWDDGFYLSSDAIFDSSDTLIASRQVATTESPLAAGASYTVTQNITLPIERIAQPYLFAVTNSDWSNHQSETNESNNAKAIAKLERSPDLVVSSATVKDAPTWGETIAITWTVTNQGSETASARWYDGFYLSSDTVLDSSDVAFASRYNLATESPLVAGGSYTASQNITLPSGHFDKPYLLAVADYPYYNSQREKNESNNAKVIAKLDLPDLVISRATASNAAPTWGETISVNWTVANQGPSKALAHWYDGFYLSSDSKLDSSDVGVGSRSMADVSPLAAGASYIVSKSFTLPYTSKDLRYLLAVTDSGNYQQEKNEGNNVKVIATLIDRPPSATSNASPLDNVLSVLDPQNLVNGLHLDDVFKAVNLDDVFKVFNSDTVTNVIKGLHLDNVLSVLNLDTVTNVVQGLQLGEVGSLLNPDTVINLLKEWHLNDLLSPSESQNAELAVTFASVAIVATALAVGGTPAAAGTLVLMSGGALFGAAIDVARQYAQMADGTRTEFSLDEVLASAKSGAIAAPVLVVVPEVAVPLAGLGLISGVNEYSQGNNNTAIFDIASSVLPFGFKATRDGTIGGGTLFGQMRGLGESTSLSQRIGRLTEIGNATKAAAQQLEGWIQKIGSNGEEVVNTDGTVTNVGEISSSPEKAESANPLLSSSESPEGANNSQGGSGDDAAKAADNPLGTPIDNTGGALDTDVGGKTIWDSITATQLLYEGTLIPRSFELTTSGGQRFWVHPNATEHFVEYAASKAVTHTPEAVRLTTQAQLTSFEAAVTEASRQGIKINEMMKVNGWELIFSQQPGDALPVIKHALYKP